MTHNLLGDLDTLSNDQHRNGSGGGLGIPREQVMRLVSGDLSGERILGRRRGPEDWVMEQVRAGNPHDVCEGDLDAVVIGQVVVCGGGGVRD
ncbi:hypothetical protein AB0M54_30810 [Actinoplanes sp. NPDC051470]|uniref:hypothetical protein n=1 Tax=Actinoplanes sp. NPDC051470 TaxID=3157224 RepID=UPI00342880BB